MQSTNTHLQKDLLTEIPAGKVYTTQQIIIGTFLGGLLTAAIMLTANFKLIGKTHAIKTTWVLSILFFILLIATAFIPELDKIPNILYSFLSTAFVAFLCNRFQEKEIKMHMENGGAKHTTGKVAGVILLGLSIFVLLALAAFALQDIVTLIT